MGIGLSMMAGPLEALGNVIPVMGSIIGGVTSIIAFIIAAVLSSITIAIAWLAHRPLLSMILLGGGVALFMAIKMIRGDRRQAA